MRYPHNAAAALLAKIEIHVTTLSNQGQFGNNNSNLRSLKFYKGQPKHESIILGGSGPGSTLLFHTICEGKA